MIGRPAHLAFGYHPFPTRRGQWFRRFPGVTWARDDASLSCGCREHAAKGAVRSLRPGLRDLRAAVLTWDSRIPPGLASLRSLGMRAALMARRCRRGRTLESSCAPAGQGGCAPGLHRTRRCGELRVRDGEGPSTRGEGGMRGYCHNVMARPAGVVAARLGAACGRVAQAAGWWSVPLRGRRRRGTDRRSARRRVHDWGSGAGLGLALGTARVRRPGGCRKRAVAGCA